MTALAYCLALTRSLLFWSGTQCRTETFACVHLDVFLFRLWSIQCPTTNSLLVFQLFEAKIQSFSDLVQCL